MSTTNRTAITTAAYGSPRFWLQTATTTPSATASPTTRRTTITIGATSRPAFVRERTDTSWTPA